MTGASSKLNHFLSSLISDGGYRLKCKRCKISIEKGNEIEWHGENLCEDCYIDTLSPAKPCDPWAVFCAKSFSKRDGSDVEITSIQSRILEVLRETGGTDSTNIIEKLKIKASDFDREIATLRHMEKVRGKLKEGKKIFCLW